MMKTNAAMISTEEAAFVLRRALGDIFAWHKALECMRNDGYEIYGLQLLPCTREHFRRSYRPVYDVAHVKHFIDEFRAANPAAEAKKPLVVRRGDYDPNKSWKVQVSTLKRRIPIFH